MHYRLFTEVPRRDILRTSRVRSSRQFAPGIEKAGLLHPAFLFVGALCSQMRFSGLPFLAAFLHRLQDLVWAVEALGVCVPDLLHQLLRGVVLLGSIGDLLLLGRESHAWQVLQEGCRVEVAEVTQVTWGHVSRPPVLSPTLSMLLSTHGMAPETTKRLALS